MAKLLKITHGKEFDDIPDYLFFCPGCECHHGVTVRQVDMSRLSEADQKTYTDCKAPRWSFNGDMDKPTFTPSIHVQRMLTVGGKTTLCHSYVTDGSIRFLDDCTHKLKGQTVELPETDSV